MKLLVLFSAWAPDDGENTRRWLDWYRLVLATHFPGDPIFVALNHGSHLIAESVFGEVGNLIGLERVAPEMHVDSDAAGYQLALGRCRPLLPAYDAVLFLHTKGISYPFPDYDSLRPLMQATIFDRAAVAERMRSASPRLVCLRGHMASAGGSIANCARFATRLGIGATPFNFGATLTLYYAPAALLHAFADALPPGYFETNLVKLGHNRFFFEGLVPSLLAMMGARPVFMDAVGFDPALNDCVSYDHSPAHNSALVQREHFRRLQQGDAYRQAPIPYCFLTPEARAGTQIAFLI